MIDSTSFGSITVDGKRYDHDIWIFLDGRIEERNTNHLFSKEEFELLAREAPEVIVFGNGQSSVARVSDEAKEAAEERGIELIAAATPEAIKLYNNLAKKKKTVAAIHVTC